MPTSFTKLGKFSVTMSLNIFSKPCLFSSSSGTPMIRILFRFQLSHSSLKLSSCFLIVFSFWFSAWLILSSLSSNSLISSSASPTLLFRPSNVFFISDMSFFISSCWFLFSNWLIFNISMSLLMVLMSLHMLLSFLNIMALNSSSVNLINCTSFISSSVEASCSFIWLLFLFFTILAITVVFGVCQIFPVGVGVLLFVAPSPGFGRAREDPL
uniref:Uncharacterized protein n=1 Tax=Molossus molossus TaxID=27622 RepID=A0A7J8J6F8_MOLMO|nr:hypothetical protein HJG59_009650 [Molossus molossus]